MCFIASAPEVDMVMAAIVGAAGLLSTMRRCKQASVYCSLTKKLW
ncbi:1-deoxy-D-xylulose 5-phosphate reductoisomerase [Vibrio sp. JCM 19236]|nr:1-deoxy-D-xylulose 5-phosphate reductoisomerase [Vibrio sp. JCM 19236]